MTHPNKKDYNYYSKSTKRKVLEWALTPITFPLKLIIYAVVKVTGAKIH